MSLNLKVIAGDEEMSLYTRTFSREVTFSAAHQCPRFELVAPTDWTLAWTIESTKGKGRVVDAFEVASGTCQ